MAKYYAREIEKRTDRRFDWGRYFKEEDAINNHMRIRRVIDRTSILEGTQEDTMNDALMGDIEKAFKHILIDINDNNTNAKENRKIVEKHLPPIQRKEYADDEIQEIISCANVYKNDNDPRHRDRDENVKNIIRTLNVVYGREFVHCEMKIMDTPVSKRYFSIISPLEMISNQKYWGYIISALYKGGKEFLITNEKIETPEDFDSVTSTPYLLPNYSLLSYTPIFSSSTYPYDISLLLKFLQQAPAVPAPDLSLDEEKKKYFVSQIGCKADEISTLFISGKHTHITYDYREI